MKEPLSREAIAMRVAREFQDGYVVNLGIGIPTLSSSFIPEGRTVIFHTENGALGFGPVLTTEEEVEERGDIDLVNAGGQFVTPLPGMSFFHHADSFAMVRGGHVDVTVLGGLQVSARGDLANWFMPERGVGNIGGSMDLAVGAKWRFYKDEDAGLEIAYVPSVTFPTGKDGTAGRLGASDEFTTLFNGIAISKDWGGRWTSGLDLGYAYPIGGKRDGYRGTLSSDVALGYQWTESVQPEIELNYTHDFNHGADADSLAATVGLIICLRDDLRLDVGVQRALAGRNCDLGTTCIVALTYTR